MFFFFKNTFAKTYLVPSRISSGSPPAGRDGTRDRRNPGHDILSILELEPKGMPINGPCIVALRTQTSEAPRKNVTIPDPFDCHVRSQEMLEHKEKTIEKVIQKETNYKMWST